MPANLPPQYFELGKKLKKAKEIEEKISILEEMLAVVPKHKGTERTRANLKRKIAKLKREKETKKKAKGTQIYHVKKEGAGQVVVCGPPNSGKTTLVNSLTGANFKVADYPFTTTLPQPAMMPYEDILIQLVDTPPITKEFFPGWLKNILRNCDLILAVFDLTKENFEKEILQFKEILKNLNLEDKKILFVANKADVNPEINFPEKISAKEKIGLKDLKRKIFENLEIVRVYSKKPGKEPDLKHPFILKKKSKLSDLIEKINPEWLSKFKFAKLFRKNLKNPLIVGKDYILRDKDIIEIH